MHRVLGARSPADRSNSTSNVDVVDIHLNSDGAHDKSDRKNEARASFDSQQGAFYARKRPTPNAHPLPYLQRKMRFHPPIVVETGSNRRELGVGNGCGVAPKTHQPYNAGHSYDRQTALYSQLHEYVSWEKRHFEALFSVFPSADAFVKGEVMRNVPFVELVCDRFFMIRLGVNGEPLPRICAGV